MSELRALVAAAQQLRAAGRPFVSASVLAVRGSGYRHAGARMIADDHEWLAGSISGGCLERDVISKGLWHTRSERVRLLTYDQTSDVLDDSVSSGCQGIVDVLLERHEPEQIAEADVFAAAERCIREEQSAAILTVIRSARAELPLGARMILQGGRLYVSAAHAPLSELAELLCTALATLSAAHTVEAAGVQALIEIMQPPIHLFVFGTGHDATPLVELARQLGWSVSVWDASPRSSARQRLQRADHYLTCELHEAVALAARAARGAAVVMGHHFARDRATVIELLASSVRYIGILGSQQRIHELLDATPGSPGASQSQRVYAPIGLRLHAQTPAEIALAILAQVQSVLAQPSVHPRADASAS